MKTSVLLVDEQEMVREGLGGLIEASEQLRIAGYARDGLEAVASAKRLAPDVIVMDTCLPGLSGIEAAHRIVEADRAAKIVMISAHQKRSIIESCVRAGAMAYVVKTAPFRELVGAIEAVRCGRSYLSPAITQLMLAPLTREGQLHPTGVLALTTREREILRRVGEGLTTRQIAAELAISPRTVESHRASIMRKLGVHHVSALVRIAIREDLVSR